MRAIDADFLINLRAQVIAGERPDIVDEGDLIAACPTLTMRDIIGKPAVSFEEVLTVICTSNDKTEMLLRIMDLPIHQ